MAVSMTAWPPSCHARPASPPAHAPPPTALEQGSSRKRRPSSGAPSVLSRSSATASSKPDSHTSTAAATASGAATASSAAAHAGGSWLASRTSLPTSRRTHCSVLQPACSRAAHRLASPCRGPGAAAPAAMRSSHAPARTRHAPRSCGVSAASTSMARAAHARQACPPPPPPPPPPLPPPPEHSSQSSSATECCGSSSATAVPARLRALSSAACTAASSSSSAAPSCIAARTTRRLTEALMRASTQTVAPPCRGVSPPAAAGVARALDRGDERRSRTRVDEPVRPTATRHQAALQVGTELRLRLTSKPRVDAGVQQRQHQVGGLAALARLCVDRLHPEQQRVQQSQLRQPRQRSLLERGTQLRERSAAATQQHRTVPARVVSATPLQNGTEALANRHTARTLADTPADLADARGAEDGPTPQRQAELVGVVYAHARADALKATSPSVSRGSIPADNLRRCHFPLVAARIF
eukprot:scaffold63421_cov60-Phaeocystis_antarctica.AAC.4